jgi:endonuclease YncB( thermonuclease family)
LAQIDAPEKKQAFGSIAKQTLSDKIYGKSISLENVSYERRYGRTLAVIKFEGKNVNLEMVREGMAWQYKQYSKDKAYAEAEQDAREHKRGFWKDKHPVPSWEFRRDYH